MKSRFEEAGSSPGNLFWTRMLESAWDILALDRFLTIPNFHLAPCPVCCSPGFLRLTPHIELLRKTVLGKDVGEFAGIVHENIWWFVSQRVGRESVGDADGPQSGIASGANVDVGISDDGRSIWLRVVLFQQFAYAFGIRFLGGETVSPINLCKELPQPQRLDDGT